jgi:hypothetical protein
LEFDYMVQIVFKGKPKEFAAPSHVVFTHNSEYWSVIFEVETRITARHIPPGAEYKEIDIERTDFLNYHLDNLDIRSQLGPRRFFIKLTDG